MTGLFLKHAIRIHAALESHPWLSKVLKINQSFKIQFTICPKSSKKSTSDRVEPALDLSHIWENG
jgi:hypothetical protein